MTEKLEVTQSETDSRPSTPGTVAPAYSANYLARAYTQAREETTPADQALIQLLEGAARFIHEGVRHIEEGDFEAKHTVLLKAQKIVTVLSNCLDASIGEEPFQNIQALYFYIYRKLSEGNVKNDPAELQEALVVLEDVTHMWRETVKTFHREESGKKAAAAPTPRGEAQPAPAPGEGLCIQG